MSDAVFFLYLQLHFSTFWGVPESFQESTVVLLRQCWSTPLEVLEYFSRKYGENVTD